MKKIEPNQDESKSKQAQLDSLERSAQACAKNLVHMMSTLRASVNMITGLSVEHMKAYSSSMDNLSEVVNTSVVDMNQLITKCQELNEDLKPVESLSQQMYPSILFQLLKLINSRII